MTDATQTQQPVPPVPAAPQPLTEEQQIEQIKLFLFQGILKNYQDYLAAIQRLPLAEGLKFKIIGHLDDSWVWVKEAFNVLQITLPKPPQPESKSKTKRKAAQKGKKKRK
jgi:hypothetical protein